MGIITTESKIKMQQLGYQHKSILVPADQFVKTIEHTPEKEVTEELTICGNVISRRLRIIEWETKNGSRCSKSIIYKDLPAAEISEFLAAD